MLTLHLLKFIAELMLVASGVQSVNVLLLPIKFLYQLCAAHSSVFNDSGTFLLLFKAY